MARDTKGRLPQLFRKNGGSLVDEWIRLQASSGAMRRDLTTEAELSEESRTFFGKLTEALESGEMSGEGASWIDVVGE